MTPMTFTACQVDIQDLFDEVLSLHGFTDEFRLSGGLGYTVDSAVVISFLEMGVRENTDHHGRFIAMEYAFIEERVNCEVSAVDDAINFSFRLRRQQTETFNQRKMEKMNIEVMVNFKEKSMESAIYNSVFWFDVHDVFGVINDLALIPSSTSIT